MMTRSTLKWTVLPLLLILLAGSTGCLFSQRKEDPLPEPPQSYLPYYDSDPLVAIDNLIENFVRAWENRDVVEYRDSILYNDQDATDGNTYEFFHFYFDPAGQVPGQTFPAFELFEREVGRATNMFSGQKGQDHLGNEIPGILSIALDLFPENSWEDPPGGTVEGHSYPDGTMRRFYGTNMLITLEGNIGSSDINAWEVQDRLVFHVIPVRQENDDTPGTYHTVYRIWKWRDIIIQ